METASLSGPSCCRMLHLRTFICVISFNPRCRFVCQAAPLFQQALSQRNASDKEAKRLSAFPDL